MPAGAAITIMSVKGKPVFVFEKHHYALHPWAEFRKRLAVAPRLLTLDYHTDTKQAFLLHASKKFLGPSPPEPEEMAKVWDAELALIDYRNPDTISRAVRHLQYDEHIDAACKAGILDVAFVIAYTVHVGIVSNEQHALDKAAAELREAEGFPFQKTYAQPPFTYTIPRNRIVELPKADSPPSDGQDDRPYRDAALEASFLSGRLALIEEICRTGAIPGLFERPFILDIDLDYLNTRKSVCPGDPSVFYNLIKRATIITIARESDCVKHCQIEGERLTSDFLEKKVLAHIETAMS
jgi:hypothetical protein